MSLGFALELELEGDWELGGRQEVLKVSEKVLVSQLHLFPSADLLSLKMTKRKMKMRMNEKMKLRWVEQKMKKKKSQRIKRKKKQRRRRGRGCEEDKCVGRGR